jgi:hypothetical protein
VDFAATESKFIPVGFTFRIPQDVKHFVVLVLLKIAISKKASSFLIIFLGEKTFSQKGCVGGDMIGERFVDGLNQLCLEGGVILRFLINHSNYNSNR